MEDDLRHKAHRSYAAAQCESEDAMLLMQVAARHNDFASVAQQAARLAVAASKVGVLAEVLAS